MNKDCIFCEIIAKELPSTIITETNEIIVIKDINPKATIHYLILPKKHFSDLQSIENSDLELVTKMLKLAKDISKNISDSNAFRLVINNGKDAGQIIFHLHIHFLSGKQISKF